MVWYAQYAQVCARVWVGVDASIHTGKTGKGLVKGSLTKYEPANRYSCQIACSYLR